MHTYFSANRFCSNFSAFEKNSSSSAADGIATAVCGGFRREVASIVNVFLFTVTVDNDSISSDSKQTTLDVDVSLL
ncbi:hypothetical protein Hanom_Chr12g01152781 [Helianthus anomalus]